MEFEGYLQNIRRIIDIHWLKALTINDEDRLIVIEGKEGSSKSTLALHVANYFMYKQNKVFDVKNIHYSVKEFEKALSKSTKGHPQIIDEGALMGFSRDTMSRESRRFVKLLTTCRSKNQLIIVCVPNVNLLDRYLREHRLQAVFKVTIRGKCDIYNAGLWKKSQYKEKYSKKMRIKRSPIYDTYPKVEKIWGIDIWKAYIAWKDKNMYEDVKPVDEKEVRDKLLLGMYENCGNYREISRITGIHHHTVRDAVIKAQKRGL